MNLIKKQLQNILFFLFCVIILAFSVRGLPGNPTPTEMDSMVWKDDGPMELSPERGRYALLYSVAENNSLSFPIELAKFAAPDVAFKDGKYVSLFAPGVSFLAIPGYLLGKLFGIAQVGAFAIIALFAILNAFLIREIAVRLKAHPLAGSIGGLAFLFATPAFAYAVSLYQHHVSTFLILSALYILIRYKGALSLAAIWMLCALSIPVDYPNIILMLPIGIAALAKTIIVNKNPKEVEFKIPVLKVLAISAALIPLLLFAWFNAKSYGNPLQLSGTLERVIEIKEDNKPLFERDILIERLKADKKPAELPEKSAMGFFQSRNLINGLYEHIFSLDRGMIVFTPVMLFGLVGLIMAIKRRMLHMALFVTVLGFNLLLYSMWGDPYGGWAFGSRYLIPSYALLSVFIAILLTRFARYNFFLLLFFMVFTYSVGVNMLGAITSNRNPPKAEAQSLESITHKKEEYTFMRNVNYLDKGEVKAFAYKSYAENYLSPWTYYTILTLFTVMGIGGLIFILRILADDRDGQRDAPDVASPFLSLKPIHSAKRPEFRVEGLGRNRMAKKNRRAASTSNVAAANAVGGENRSATSNVALPKYKEGEDEI